MLKHWSLWLGRSLTLAGLAYVIYVGIQLRSQLVLGDLQLSTWVALALLSASYLIMGVILAISWRRLLHYFGEDVSRKWALIVYGKTQIAKYLPGNIFHYAGRQLAGMSQGVGGKILAKASFLEFVLILVTAGAVLLFHFVSEVFPSASELAALVALGLIIFLVVLWKTNAGSLAWVFVSYLVVLILPSLLFAVVLQSLEPDAGMDLWQVTIVFIAAWITGLVTPGAPGGIGVREALIIAMLNGTGFEASVLIAALLARVANILGDFVFFVVSLSLEARKNGATANQNN